MIDYKEILNDLDSFLNFLLENFPDALKYEEKWKRYHMKIIEENKKISLVSKRDLYFIARKHFTDSVLISKFIKESSITDIGSGAGFPGVPIAILNPDKKIFLVERNLKKSIFLKEIKIYLNLKNVEVIREDISNMKDIPGDAFITRASNYENILKILKRKKIKDKKFYAIVSSKINLPSIFIKNPLTQENFRILEIRLG